MHNAIYLVICFTSISGHYLLLNAQFLAFVNLIVYVGAIMILMVFTIMLMNLNNENEVHIPIPTQSFPYYKWKDVECFYRNILK